MSDDFDDIRAAFGQETPAPDASRKAANLRLAAENFEKLQGSRGGARLTIERGPMARMIDGVKNMLNAMTTRGGLTATTALVAVGLFMVLPQGNDLLTPDLGTRTETSGLDETRLDDFAAGSTNNVRSRSAETQAQPQVKVEADKPIAGEMTTESVIVEEIAEEPMVMEAETFADTDNSAVSQDIVGGLATQESREMAQGSAADAVTSLIAPAPSAPTAAKRLVPPKDDRIVLEEADTEAFSNAPTQSVKITTEEPVSTFSIDVDTASYSVVRSSLMAGVMPPRDAVRVEELVNYFPYAYPAPEGTIPFQPTVTVAPTPWNAGTNLVHIGIQGTLPALEDRPPLNLVFLIDTSGSMQSANKLPLLKQSFRMMLSELRPEDQVSIVTYAGSAGQVLEPTAAAERSTILAALDRLEAGGSTAGQAGLQQAYATAESMADEGEVTRVILATDGDFNVGLSNPDDLKDFIADKRESGTYLSVLGFGRGNLDDATMQALAQNGNGQAAYIDTLSEARKVLVDQLTGALFPIANDVKIQIEFNPATIAEYRLIGYETRALRREDFNNDKVDAGDIGAGHRVTAIYEVTPVGSDALRNGPSRYSPTPASESAVEVSDELGFFKMRYKTPGDSTSQLIEQPILPAQGALSNDMSFSMAMAGFGQLLRGGDYLGNWDYDDAIQLATSSKGMDSFGYRAEAITLMRLAEALDRQ